MGQEATRPMYVGHAASPPPHHHRHGCALHMRLSHSAHRGGRERATAGAGGAGAQKACGGAQGNEGMKVLGGGASFGGGGAQGGVRRPHGAAATNYKQPAFINNDFGVFFGTTPPGCKL